MGNQEIAVYTLYTSIASVAITLVGAVLIVIQLFLSNRTAKAQNTLEVAMSGLRDELHLSYRALVKKFDNNPNHFQLTIDQSKAIRSDDDDMKTVKHLLNFYERLAVGIKSGAIDQRYVKKLLCTAVRSVYWQTANYIAVARSAAKNESLYKDFEELAQKWDRKPANGRHFFDRAGHVITGKTFDQLPLTKIKPREMAKETTGN